MAEEKKEQAADTSAPAAGGGGGKLVLILTAVNVVATLAIIGFLFVSFQKEKNKPKLEDIVANEPAAEGEEAGGGEHGGGHGKPAAKKSGNPNFGKMITLEQFTINLSSAGSVAPKYARVNISLEVPSDDTEAEVNQKMPQVRNVVIDLFNSKRPADLATSEGRNYLKEEIKNALNSFLVTGKVKGVFFTNFAVTG